MAVKKNFNNVLNSWQDVFDTQDALDSGILNSTISGNYTSTENYKEKFLGISTGRSGTHSQNFEQVTDKDTFAGSILGGIESIGAYKKRKLEQSNASKNGIGTSQSILGGTVI